MVGWEARLGEQSRMRSAVWDSLTPVNVLGLCVRGFQSVYLMLASEFPIRLRRFRFYLQTLHRQSNPYSSHYHKLLPRRKKYLSMIITIYFPKVKYVTMDYSAWWRYIIRKMNRREVIWISTCWTPVTSFSCPRWSKGRYYHPFPYYGGHVHRHNMGTKKRDKWKNNYLFWFPAPTKAFLFSNGFDINQINDLVFFLSYWIVDFSCWFQEQILCSKVDRISKASRESGKNSYS